VQVILLDFRQLKKLVNKWFKKDCNSAPLFASFLTTALCAFKMSNKMNSPKKKSKPIIHLGTFKFSGESEGTYSLGVAKLYPDLKKDLLDSAESFLKAADRCLNSCKVEEGIEQLTTPGAVCASFSCELFLKYILLIENGKNAVGHDLANLFVSRQRRWDFQASKIRDIYAVADKASLAF